jgi:hypothetical protein
MEKTYKAREWQEAEIDHKRHNPSEGDYWWTDHFCPVLVVLAVTGRFVTICSQTKDAGDDKWTWDLTKPSILDRDKFEKKLDHCRVGSSQFWAVREFKNPPKAADVLASASENTGETK